MQWEEGRPVFGFDAFSIMAQPGKPKDPAGAPQETVVLPFAPPKSEPNLRSSYVFPTPKGPTSVERTNPAKDKPVPKDE